MQGKYVDDTTPISYCVLSTELQDLTVPEGAGPGITNLSADT